MHDGGRTRRLGFALPAYAEGIGVLSVYFAILSNKVYTCFPLNITINCGPGSSVGIATDYGMDGPGSNPGGDEIFRLSRPALGSTKTPVQWVPCISRG